MKDASMRAHVDTIKSSETRQHACSNTRMRTHTHTHTHTHTRTHTHGHVTHSARQPNQYKGVAAASSSESTREAGALGRPEAAVSDENAASASASPSSTDNMHSCTARCTSADFASASSVRRAA
ncbi:MAG: hypothetical protein EOO41_05165 [Methanobacteriota archaeon]|nr:MAG: hypothetical protein EOO41_05165 [Euryarchaeota archaeon]